MNTLILRTSGILLLLLPWLFFSGCNQQQETSLTTTVREQETAPPVEAPAEELLLSQRAFIEVSEKVTPAVVNISAERIRTVDRLSPLFEEFFGDFFRMPRPERRERSLGSGFVLSKDGYILT
ncbi:MAG: peptidase, partial [Gammaproteobacteria bacterium]|nr:peptidase [Gammaproteobacteria bacterium]